MKSLLTPDELIAVEASIEVISNQIQSLDDAREVLVKLKSKPKVELPIMSWLIRGVECLLEPEKPLPSDLSLLNSMRSEVLQIAGECRNASQSNDRSVDKLERLLVDHYLRYQVFEERKIRTFAGMKYHARKQSFLWNDPEVIREAFGVLAETHRSFLRRIEDQIDALSSPVETNDSNRRSPSKRNSKPSDLEISSKITNILRVAVRQGLPRPTRKELADQLDFKVTERTLSRWFKEGEKSHSPYHQAAKAWDEYDSFQTVERHAQPKSNGRVTRKIRSSDND